MSCHQVARQLRTRRDETGHWVLPARTTEIDTANLPRKRESQ
jgi:hypothetical protein